MFFWQNRICPNPPTLFAPSDCWGSVLILLLCSAPSSLVCWFVYSCFFVIPLPSSALLGGPHSAGQKTCLKTDQHTWTPITIQNLFPFGGNDLYWGLEGKHTIHPWIPPHFIYIKCCIHFNVGVCQLSLAQRLDRFIIMSLLEGGTYRRRHAHQTPTYSWCLCHSKPRQAAYLFVVNRWTEHSRYSTLREGTVIWPVHLVDQCCLCG